MTYRVEDLAAFSKLQLESQDVDPAYPVLKSLEKGMSTEQALWFTLVYVAFYNLRSAVEACAVMPEPVVTTFGFGKFSTGIERRGLRGGKVHTHLASLMAIRDRWRSFDVWLRQGFGIDLQQNWLQLQRTLQEPWGNGRWAAYKTGEILMKVHDFPVQPTDMGNENSSGPRQGLELFYSELPKDNKVASILLIDRVAQELQGHLSSLGVVLGIEQLETMLCDFHAMAEGAYYCGHDIDLMQEQLQGATNGLMEPAWEARKESIPQKWLGELNGRPGRDWMRMKLYKETGEILGR